MSVLQKITHANNTTPLWYSVDTPIPQGPTGPAGPAGPTGPSGSQTVFRADGLTSTLGFTPPLGPSQEFALATYSFPTAFPTQNNLLVTATVDFNGGNLLPATDFGTLRVGVGIAGGNNNYSALYQVEPGFIYNTTSPIASFTVSCVTNNPTANNTIVIVVRNDSVHPFSAKGILRSVSVVPLGN